MLNGFERPVYHLSFDDVFDCIIEIADQKIPLFDHPLFHYLKLLHDTFGASITLHLFYQKEISGRQRTLKDVPDLKKQLKQSGANTWLFFGPHSRDFDTCPYNQRPDEQKRDFNNIYKEIKRFAGKESFSRYVRLHYYSESHELSSYFRKKGVDGLFTTDKSAISYRMGKKEKEELLINGYTMYNDMRFVRTQFRAEFYTSRSREDIREEIASNIAKYKFATLYTHEYELIRPEIMNTIQIFLEEFKKQNILPISQP